MTVAPQPKYDARFVEISSDGRTEIQNINKFPSTIGRSGNIKPLICNGHLSNKHCTIEYDLAGEFYLVTDGADGVRSTNHIYICRKGECEFEPVEFAQLKELSDKLYLMNRAGVQGFIELYDPLKAIATNPRDTQSLDPALIQIRSDVESVKEAIQELKIHNEWISDGVSVLRFLGETPWRKTLTGIGFSWLIIVSLIGSYRIYEDRDKIFINPFKFRHDRSK